MQDVGMMQKKGQEKLSGAALGILSDWPKALDRLRSPVLNLKAVIVYACLGESHSNTQQ